MISTEKFKLDYAGFKFYPFTSIEDAKKNELIYSNKDTDFEVVKLKKSFLNNSGFDDVNLFVVIRNVRNMINVIDNDSPFYFADYNDKIINHYFERIKI